MGRGRKRKNVAKVPVVEGSTVIVEEGGVVMVKSPELLTVPDEVVTEILPVVAPEGTTATSWVVVPELSVAVTPLNLTVLEVRVGEKLVPVMVTELPTAPLVGENIVMVGVVGGATTVARVTEI